jgi:phenylpropionate dioxygenase-like ring-hydroxylating dioxygenase large terminal subunit
MKFSIPNCPKSWHFVGTSDQFSKSKPVAVKIYKKEYLVYRNANNELIAMKNVCPHMGARLSDGEIKEGRVVCPFHKWEFGSDGQCESNPFTGCRIKNAKSTTYPITERHGLVFIFNDIKATYPLPFFDGLNEKEFYCDKGVKIFQEVMWHVAPSNAFDLPHFKYVHHRHPVKNSEMTFPTPYSTHIEHEYLVKGNNLADRFLRLVYGEKGKLIFTSWGGGLIFARAVFDSFENYMFFYLQPTEDNKSISHLFTYRKRKNSGFKGFFEEVFHRLTTMKLRSHFSRIFFQKEATELTQIDYEKSLFHYLDENLVRYLNWLHTVNKDQYEPGMTIEEPLKITLQKEDETPVLVNVINNKEVLNPVHI